MKKWIALLLVLVSLFSAASAEVIATTAAEIDLSGMGYEELVALKDRINLAIWKSEEWNSGIRI